MRAMSALVMEARCQRLKIQQLQVLTLKILNHYMNPKREVKKKPRDPGRSVRAVADLEHDGRPLEPELGPQLVFQVSLVRKVQVHVVVDGQGEGGRRDPDLGGEEDLHRRPALGR